MPFDNFIIAYFFLFCNTLQKSRKPDALHIIGGGSKDGYLNKLTANALDIPVYTGPTEATAIGNLLSQMLGAKVFSSVAEARECVFNSFDVKKV